MLRARRSRTAIPPLCSDKYFSTLTKLFAARVAESTGDPRKAIESAIRGALPRRRIANVDHRLLWLRRQRRIRHVKDSLDVAGDGTLQPLGTCYADGFDIFVNKAASLSRRRFTLAHELSHTFFYELVPELKFTPHHVDPCEERLCNLGAAVILMPRWQLEDACYAPAAGYRQRHRGSGSQVAVTSLSKLFQLAHDFQVSAPAMLNRLRDLSLSRCHLHVLHRNSSGAFLFPGTTRDSERWSAIVPHLERAWVAKGMVHGHEYVEVTDGQGVKRTSRISYQATARENRIYFLWCRGGLESGDGGSLFTAASSQPV
jgi:Zn-dependent peptidase ImmA (M78 family)